MQTTKAKKFNSTETLLLFLEYSSDPHQKNHTVKFFLTVED